MLEVFGSQKNSTRLISDEQLLLIAQKIVHRYVYARAIPQKEEEDVKMAIVEKFLLKHDAIRKAYNGESKVTTYCISILNRMCCEVIRKELKQWKQQPTENFESGNTDFNSTSTQLVINDEINQLEKIINLFDEEKDKVRLFMAYYYQLQIRDSDIKLYDSNFEKNKLKSLFLQIDIKNKGDIYVNLAFAVERVENKKIKADAVRMWLNKVIEQIITRLNGPFKRANYNKESVQILFEYFYSKHNESG